MISLEAGASVFADGASVVPGAAGTAVGLGGRVGAAAGVAVAVAAGWVDVPWHAPSSNRVNIANSPMANLRNRIDRC